MLASLEKYRDVQVCTGSGDTYSNIVYQMRTDGEKKHLFIAHLYRKYYLYDVTLGYHGIPSFVMLIIGLALSVALVFIAAPFEKESHMDPYRRI